MEPHTGGRRPVVASDADQALSTLCQTYWYPLYAYLRRRGHAREDTRDLTQAFFVKLLEEGTIRVADPRRGKFRSFLLTALKHFVTNHQRHAQTLKRGAGHSPTPLNFLDFQIAEGRYAQELTHGATPEEVFERR
jgi:RNA polymerase sigma-70 factor (ECF subfamily)